MNAGQRRKGVKVVWPSWLQDSAVRWSRQPEDWYLLPVPSAGESLPVGTAGDEEERAEGGGGVPTAMAGLTKGESMTTGEEKEGEGEEGEDAWGAEMGMEAMDWNDAADEVDAFLNATDEEEDESERGYLTDQTDR